MEGIEPGSYWRINTKVGRPRIYESPEQMAEEINAYFEFVECNPLKEAQLMKYKTSRDTEIVKVFKLSKMRAMTIQGLCNYLNINVDTFYEYEKRPEFTEILTRAKQIMYAQKLEGSAAGLLNPSIIARELGLTDKSQTTIVKDQPLFDLSDDEAEDGIL